MTITFWRLAKVAIDGLADDRSLPLVSSGAVDLPRASLGFSTGLMVRDPDRHALLPVGRSG